MGHLTEPEITGYRARTLTPERLLPVTEHLDSCEDCRAKLLAASRTSEALAELQQSIQDHLSAEQIQLFVDGALQPDDAARVRRHLTSCPECNLDVKALREFANARPVRARGPRWAWWMAAAAAAVLAAIGLSLWLRRPSVVVALNDEGGRVTLDSRGHFQGVAGLSPEQSEAVRRVLEGTTLTPSPNLTDLQPPRGTLMGSVPAAAFHLTAPVGTAVLSSLPNLQWTSPGDGVTYVVTLKDLGSGKITSSPPLHSLEWTPSEPLRAGAVYEWQVSASIKDRAELAPSPPAPPAKFRVVDAPTAARLNSLPASHVIRATLYAEAGLIDDAEREATALAAANPGSAVASDLLRRIRMLRPAAP